MQVRSMLKGAILGLACFACGCGSTGVVTRGQDPHGPAPGQFQTYRSPAGAVQDHFSGQHTAYFSDGNGALDRLHQANCQQQQGGAYCPENCPPGGYGATCPHGYHGGSCRSCGGCRAPDWYPKHHRTYSYSVPNDLSYPAQGAVGGAIVYPYYTHKGPSDFFRQK